MSKEWLHKQIYHYNAGADPEGGGGYGPPGARFTNTVDRQTYRQKCHRQISECGENFLLPFQVSLFLSET